MVPPSAGFGRNAFPQAVDPGFPRAGAPFRQMVSESALQKVGCWLLYIYIVIALSRIFDFTLRGPRVASVFYIGILIVTLCSGGLFNIFKTTLGWTMAMLCGWCALSTLFSTWHGGSAEQFKEVFKAFMLSVAILAIPFTPKAVLRLQQVAGLSIASAAILSWFFGRMSLGRLVLDGGTYADPNQFAMALLIAIPLLVASAAQSKSFVGKTIPILFLIPTIIAFLRTGSRGALIGLAAVFVVAFFLMPAKQKILLVVGTLTLGCLGVLTLPSYVRARLLTVFEGSSTAGLTDEEAKQLNGSDVSSSGARFSLLMDSIGMTLDHPLLGVGLGQFPNQNVERKRAQGNPFANHSNNVTHNVYTQFSSEAGIPALALYVALLVQSYLLCGRIRKFAPELAPSADGLRLGMVALAFCGFFLAVAYSQLFYILGSITARFYLTALEMRRSGQYPAMAVPAGVQRPQWGTQQGFAPVPAARPARHLPSRVPVPSWRTSAPALRNKL